jgi:uncharacterized protein YciI
LIAYKKPLEEIDYHLAAHRSFLDEGYKNDFFIVSGAKNPRTGGVIISQLSNRDQLVINGIETVLPRMRERKSGTIIN